MNGVLDTYFRRGRQLESTYRGMISHLSLHHPLGARGLIRTLENLRIFENFSNFQISKKYSYFLNLKKISDFEILKSLMARTPFATRRLRRIIRSDRDEHRFMGSEH